MMIVCAAVLYRHLRVLCELDTLRLQPRLLSGSRCHHGGDQQARDGAKARSRPARAYQREVSRLPQIICAVHKLKGKGGPWPQMSLGGVLFSPSQ